MTALADTAVSAALPQPNSMVQALVEEASWVVAEWAPVVMEVAVTQAKVAVTVAGSLAKAAQDSSEEATTVAAVLAVVVA